MYTVLLAAAWGQVLRASCVCFVCSASHAHEAQAHEGLAARALVGGELKLCCASAEGIL